jgi:hypothetical protein
LGVEINVIQEKLEETELSLGKMILEMKEKMVTEMKNENSSLKIVIFETLSGEINNMTQKYDDMKKYIGKMNIHNNEPREEQMKMVESQLTEQHRYIENVEKRIAVRENWMTGVLEACKENMENIMKKVMEIFALINEKQGSLIARHVAMISATSNNIQLMNNGLTDMKINQARIMKRQDLLAEDIIWMKIIVNENKENNQRRTVYEDQKKCDKHNRKSSSSDDEEPIKPKKKKREEHVKKQKIVEILRNTKG